MIVYVDVVVSCSLDVQRPLREEFDSYDDVVFYQRQVEQYEAGLFRLESRPQAARDMRWDIDVATIQDFLNGANDKLNKAISERRYEQEIAKYGDNIEAESEFERKRRMYQTVRVNVPDCEDLDEYDSGDSQWCRQQ